jgi:hypothetical protein
MAGKTGPTSEAGKQKVAGNAVKHGLRSNKWMLPEERKAFDALAADLKFRQGTVVTLEEVQAAAMPDIRQVDLLSRYQTTLDRQLSKSIGELMVLKANAMLSLPSAL